MEDRIQSYKEAKLGHRVGFGKRPAIVVVDLQKAFTDPNASAGGDLSETIENVNKLTDEARKKNIKIFFARLGYQSPCGIDLGTWGHKVLVEREFLRNTENYEMDDRLKINEEDIIFEKHWASAFFGSHLVQMLIPLHIDTVIVTGCTVAGCLYATALDSCSYGFRTIVASDAASDRSEEMRNLFMWNIDQKYADVMTVKQISMHIQELEVLDYDMLW